MPIKVGIYKRLTFVRTSLSIIPTPSCIIAAFDVTLAKVTTTEPPQLFDTDGRTPLAHTNNSRYWESEVQHHEFIPPLLPSVRF